MCRFDKNNCISFFLAGKTQQRSVFGGGLTLRTQRQIFYRCIFHLKCQLWAEGFDWLAGKEWPCGMNGIRRRLSNEDLQWQPVSVIPPRNTGIYCTSNVKLSASGTSLTHFISIKKEKFEWRLQRAKVSPEEKLSAQGSVWTEKLYLGFKLVLYTN